MRRCWRFASRLVGSIIQVSDFTYARTAYVGCAYRIEVIDAAADDARVRHSRQHEMRLLPLDVEFVAGLEIQNTAQLSGEHDATEMVNNLARVTGCRTVVVSS